MRERLNRAGVIEIAAVILAWAVFGTDRQADLEVFLSAGRDVVHGLNPYVPATSPELLSGHAFVYPWLSAWLFAPLALLPDVLARAAFMGLGVVAVLAGARLLGVPRGWATAALLLCAPFARNAELGAVNAVFFFLLAAMWRWRHRAAVVATTVTLLIGVKLFLAPLLLWVVLTRSLKCTLLTVAGLFAFFGLSFGLGPIGPHAYFELLRRLSDYMGHRGMSLESAIAHFDPQAPAWVIVLAVVASALVLLLVEHLRSGRPDHPGLLGAIVILSLLATPMLWRHYLLLGFFVLALVRHSPRALVAGAVFSWLVIGSERVPPALGLDARFVLQYLAAAGLFGVCLASSRTRSPVRSNA